MLFKTSRISVTPPIFPQVCVPPTAFANEQGGNTVLTHYMGPNSGTSGTVYEFSDLYQLNGTIGAGPYTIEALETQVVIDNGGLGNNWSWNWFDAGEDVLNGQQFILLIDTNVATRTDQLWIDANPAYVDNIFYYEPEFFVGQQGFELIGNDFIDNGHDQRYFRLDGSSCYRESDGLGNYYAAPQYQAHSGDMPPDKIERYDINEIGITPDGIFAMRFTMKNQEDSAFMQFNARLLTVGPIFPGFCRFGLAKLP